MINDFDKGMDDFYLGKEIPKNPSIEYLNAYSYAESLYQKDPREQEQIDDREPQQEFNEINNL
jgi:hypothetical protein